MSKYARNMKSGVSCEIPEPVILNCWKHHAGFIKSKINEYKGLSETDLEHIRKEILLIGDSLMDLYLGDLSPLEISGAIITKLDHQKVSGIENYGKWIRAEGKDYREVEIDDRSMWTLRFGETQRYIHTHPSRYSPHTIRVRSSSLKSAILFCILHGDEPSDILSHINGIRKEFLDLPPLKSLNSASALLKLVRIFS